MPDQDRLSPKQLLSAVKPSTIAHLSDLHLDGSRERSEVLERTIALLQEMSGELDLIVVSGDLSEQGRLSDYEELIAAFKALQVPVRMCPGNHDDRSNFALTVLGQQEVNGPAHQHWQESSVSVLALDSTVPGRDEGTLTPETGDWLDRELARVPTGRHVVVMLHHTPIRWQGQDIASLDDQGTRTLGDVLNHEVGVTAILGGHMHNMMISSLRGTPAIAAPSLAPRVSPPWSCVTTSQLNDPAFAIHAIDANGLLTTYLQRIP
ncbi:metallophosphoesterase [Ferrimicrobium sp.]|uniref:metallophosphoesterase family protein n=1 Tax=Ferrimicrobium sp. TaxID=2926050 RepID=UPI002618C5D0|nr:metallophosphoesterase [Ferrimicrobium sp.]